MSKSKVENGGNKIHDEDEVNNKVNQNVNFNNKRLQICECADKVPPKIHENVNSNKEIVDMKQKKKKALMEFRCIVEDAILGNYLLGKPNKNLPPREAAMARAQLREITLWGVPLLPTKGHEGTDIILLKFLKARDFKVHEAFEMLRKTLKWRKETNVDLIIQEEENLDRDLAKIFYLNSKDRDGRPLYYNVYGALKDKKLRKKLCETQDNCEKFLRLKVQFMEKGLKELNFRIGEANSIVQIIDLKNSPGPSTKELRQMKKKTWDLLQNNYPDLIHRNIIVNVPFWFYARHVLGSVFINQKSKNKFVVARPSEVTKTLLKFVSPECLPVEYGGLYRENDEFSPEDKASELIVKKNSAACIQIPVPEAGVTMVWDLTVVGWDISYKEEFIPDDEGSYKVLLQNEKEKKGGGSMRNSFYINEPGKIAITIDNDSFKKKRVFYRYKTKPTVPMYIILKK